MLSNAYFLAKFRFDTAENEPAKNLQNFRKMHLSKKAARGPGQPQAAARGRAGAAHRPRRARLRRGDGDREQGGEGAGPTESRGVGSYTIFPRSRLTLLPIKVAVKI